MKRTLVIEKYRNIGIEEEQSLLINSSLKNGEYGNLIILIGENNSGKSNVLDALTRFKNKKIESRDITNLEFDEQYCKPVLSLVTTDGSKEYSCSLEYGHTVYSFFSNTEDYTKVLSAQDALIILDALSQYQTFPNEFREVLDNENASRQEVNQTVKDFLASLRKIYREARSYNNYAISNMTAWLNQNYPNLANYLKTEEIDRFNAEYKKHYGVDAIPNVFVYEDAPISDVELHSNPDSINSFLSSVLDDIGYKKEEVIRAYSIYKEQGNNGILGKLEKELNKKAASIAKKFNSIYKLDEAHYRFSFRAESNKFSLCIFKNDEPLTLSFQSTGFRWFFNLYFNLLAKHNMNPGDILIMDEPATHLHIAGQAELRSFLKQFAIKNGVTVIIATHSPFLIDADNLDEIRVVQNIDGRAFIKNDFSSIDPEDSDTLSSIRQALTVRQHILQDPDKQMIFVEGITDYNYYTKVARLLGDDYRNISFVPINGIGNDPEKQKKVLRQIQILGRKRDFVLLVDGDKAGIQIKKTGNSNDLKIRTLSDVDANFKEVEDLFSEDDRKNLGIQKEDGDIVKSSILSSNIKNYRTENDFSDTTKMNFKKVLDYLIQELS